MSQQCKAKSKRSGEPCRRWSIQGGTVCIVHGGKSPRAKAAAARVNLDAEIRKAANKIEWQPVGDPLTALSEVAGEITAFKDILRAKIEDMQSWTGYDDKGAEQLRALVAGYQAALSQTTVALATIAKLNIDERLAKIDERVRLTIIRALEATLAESGMTGPAMIAAKASFGRHLRAVS